MLAIGTAATTTMFAVVEGVLLRSPFAQPNEIAAVTAVRTDGTVTRGVPRELFDQLGRLTHIFSAVGELGISSPILTGVDEPRRAQVECVPASMAAVLGATPLMGRWFSADEDRPGGPGVGVVSHRFWQRTLGGDPGVLGRTIALDGEPVAVIGVMRPGFGGPRSLRDRDIWVPSTQSTAGQARYGCQPRPLVNPFARLRPGLSFADAETALAAAIAPSTATGMSRLGVFPIEDETLEGVRGPLAALMGAVVAVLLIACANVANLGLERLLGRRREIAVRLALGASRGRVVRQTLLEQMLLVVFGAVAGVFLAALAMDSILAIVPRYMPNLETIAINGRVLAAAIGVSLAAGLVVGLVPAMQASSASLRYGLAMDDRASTPRSRGMRAVLVVSELALGVALLVCALLMIRTFLTLRPSAPGFDPANKLVALTRLPSDWTDADRRQFVDNVSRQLLATPGVRAVAGTTYIPMSRSIDIRPITIGDVSGNVWTATVTPNYFDLMHIPLTGGRGFLDSDDASRSAAIVNEAFVRRWLPGRAALGSTVIVRLDPKTRFETRIVGVIADTRAMGADTRSRPELYLPFAQLVLGSPYFVIAAAPDTLARVPALLRTIVDRVRPGQLVDRIDAFDAMLATEVSTPRFGAWLFGLFAAVAVALAAIGLTATLSWSVTARRREIGIRMALGASHERVRRLIVWQTLGFAGAGITIGLALAFWATRYIASWLYGVAPTDPATFAACAIGMLAMALVAAYLPARRATRIDPLIALRAE